MSRDAFANEFRRAILNRINGAYINVLYNPTEQASAQFHDVITGQLILATACYHAERISSMPEEDREIAILQEVMNAHPVMFDEYEHQLRTVLSGMLSSLD